jgi:hypothetical protein
MTEQVRIGKAGEALRSETLGVDGKICEVTDCIRRRIIWDVTPCSLGIIVSEEPTAANFNLLL